MAVVAPLIGGSSEVEEEVLGEEPLPKASTVPVIMKEPFIGDVTSVAFSICGCANMAVDVEVEVGTVTNFPIGGGSEGTFTTTLDNYVTGIFKVSCVGLVEGTTYYWRAALTNGADTIYYPNATHTEGPQNMAWGPPPVNPNSLAQVQDRPTNNNQGQFLCTVSVANTWPLSLITDSSGIAAFTNNNLKDKTTCRAYQTQPNDPYYLGAWGMWDDGSGIKFWSNRTEDGVYIGNPAPFASVKTDSYPRSYVMSLTPYWDNISPRTIQANALDVEGIENVTLWSRFSTDNSTWTNWTAFSTDETEPWEWNFTFSNGEGHYGFFTTCVNVTGESEGMKNNPNASCGYDITPPYLGGFIPPPYWTNQNSISINSSLEDDLGGIAPPQELWYDYEGSGWVLYGASPAGMWSFNWPGEGNCDFVFIATDKAGNIRPWPGTPDFSRGYDIQIPTTLASPIPVVVSNPIQINATGWDNGPPSGLAYVELWYSLNNQPCVLIGNDFTVPYEWFFDFPEGYGLYEFRTRGMDNAGNYEPKHITNDTWCWCDFGDPIPTNLYNGQNFRTFTSDITPGWTSEDLALDVISYINTTYGETLEYTDVSIMMYDSVTGTYTISYYFWTFSMWMNVFPMVEGDCYIIILEPGALTVQPREYTYPNDILTSYIPIDLYNGQNFRGTPVSKHYTAINLLEDIIEHLNTTYGEVIAKEDITLTEYNSVTGLYQACYYFTPFANWLNDFAIDFSHGYIIELAPGALSVQPRAYTPS